MAKVDVSVTVKAEKAFVYLDHDRDPFLVDSGTAALQLDEGTIHDISWRLRGTPGYLYSVEITAPPDLKISKSDHFTAIGAVTGMAEFKVPSAAGGGQRKTGRNA
ncbi:MAG TPA: hypothetical protein VG871_07225 [Vicinamibacterales bacterium]|nr:hypothetical protein [Vicinamibacterales bacterium]